MPDASDNYPIIPHENAGAEDCWGCLVPKIDGEQVRLVCNECGAVAAMITREQFEGGFCSRGLRFAEVTTAWHPHCGAVQTCPGFSSVDAFICSERGRGVSIERSIQ
jgi:hypothetical protein